MSISIEFLNLIPDAFKLQLLSSVVGVLAKHTEDYLGDAAAQKIKGLTSERAFSRSFNEAMERAIERFRSEYLNQDEDLVEVIVTDTDFWKAEGVRAALIKLLQHPNSWRPETRDKVLQHFTDVLPRRVGRERVDRAVSFLLYCLAEEIWTLPGAKELREVYSLQFQKLTAEASRQQVALLEAQLQATTQLSADVRQVLIQLTGTLEEYLLAPPLVRPSLPRLRPFHNLPRAEYIHFVGRTEEREWIKLRLNAQDRAWQIALTGIGGIGKSALAQAIAYEYKDNYTNFLPEERFEAIIWISAKEELLTIQGPEPAELSGRILRTLEDVYTSIAQTLEREDITRSLPKDQGQLVEKALQEQRTLLIIDNLESVTDERVSIFLRNLPPPTKALITSREYIDTAAIRTLTGLALEEADTLITEESALRNVTLDKQQRELLFKRTGGLPLPIKLSVARLSSGETFDQVVRWLGNAIGDLPEYCISSQVNLSRQRDPYAWQVLLSCAFFDREAGAARDSLGYIADLSTAERDEALTTLLRLSLVNRTANDRFHLLPIVQRYASVQLEQVDFRAKLASRWLTWLTDFAQTYGLNLDVRIEDIFRVGEEYPNLRLAIRWCHTHAQWPQLLKIANGTWLYPYLSDLLAEAFEIIESALHGAGELQDERSSGWFYLQLARLGWSQGQYEGTLLEILDKAEYIASKYKDSSIIWLAMRIRFGIAFYHKRYDLCERLAQNMLTMATSLNNLQFKAESAERLAQVVALHGEFGMAHKWLDQGEQWLEELGAHRILAWSFYRRGGILFQQGEFIRAEIYLLKSQEMAASWGENRFVARISYLLTQVYIALNRPLAARSAAERARDLFERLGITKELAETKELLQTLDQKS